MNPEDITKTTVAHRINTGTGKIQYNAMQIITAAKQYFKKNAFATLSIMADDLYPYDTWNFCYGWAEYKGGSGVFSLARYDPKFSDPDYDNADRDDLILIRACRILTHEMTHMFGIFHCIFYKCAMNGINTEEEANRSPLDLCPVCLRKLQLNIGFNVLERYTKMLNVLNGFPDVFKNDREFVAKRVDYLSKQGYSMAIQPKQQMLQYKNPIYDTKKSAKKKQMH